jgi:glyoxylase-like metal-dependent hydrolase (beta-lactamase superfamily II)
MQLLRGLYLVGGRHFFRADPGRAGADCNVFAVRTDEGVVLVDCGYDRVSLEVIDQNLRYWGMEPGDVRCVLLTHSHFDHTGNARALKERGARLVAHHTVAAALAAGDERTIHYAFGRADFPTCEVDLPLGERDTVRVGQFAFDAINIPGHSDGSMAYLTECDGRRVMFVGDFVFHERPPTADGTLAWSGGTEFDTDKFLDSLLRVQRMRVDALLPGHGAFLLTNGSAIVDHALAVALRAWGNRYATRRRGAPLAEPGSG